MDHNLKKIISIIAAEKISLFSLVVVAFFIHFPFNQANFNENFQWRADSAELASRFHTWDSQYYLAIAEKGYEASGPASANYFPLWPFVIRAAAPLFFGNYLLAALTFSNLFSFLALLIFCRWVARRDPENVASALIFFLVFPGSLFFFFPYSEGLFLFLTVSFFDALDRDDRLAAYSAAYLSVLARPSGVFLIVPILLMCFDKKKKTNAFLLLGTVLAGLATYFFIMKTATGSALSFLSAQNLFPANHNLNFLRDPLGLIRDFFNIQGLHHTTGSLLDRLFFVGCICALPGLFKKDKKAFGYSLGLTLFPLFSGTLMSFMRYAAVIFPVFLIWAGYFKERKVFRNRVIVILVAMKIAFTLSHSASYWAG